MLATGDMVFSYQDKVIIKYLQIKYKCSATKIVNDHPKHEWNMNGVKKLLKKFDRTCDVAWKEGCGWSKSVCTEENIKVVEEIILSQEDLPRTHSTPAETAHELNTNCQSVFCIIDQDLDLHPLSKVWKHTDSNIEKPMICSKLLLSKYTQKTSQVASFSDKKFFKKKQLFNSQNNVVYVLKKMRKAEVPEERLFCEIEAFS